MSVNLNYTAYLSTSSHPNEDGPYTRMAWMRRSSTATTQFVFNNMSTYLNCDSLYVTGTGQFVQSIYQGYGNIEEQSTGPGYLPVDTWQHVTVLRNSATDIRLIVNGVELLTLTSHDVGSRGAAYDWTIGQHADFTGRYAFDGQVHAPKVFDSALTLAGIAEEMDWSLPVLPAYSAFVNDPAVDVSGNSRPWTVVGTLGTAGADPDIGYDPSPSEPSVTPGSLISIPPYPHLRLKMKDYATRQGIFNAYLLS